MKVAGSKAISSPSRGAGGGAENYPPPLIMRFLRSNAGSKSRGGGGSRSRSSPMFVVRKKNVAGTIEIQEPSSPKVTCIGQVRVGRSNNSTPSKPGQFKQSQGSCTCFPVIKCSLCTPTKPKWPKLASFFRFGCCKKGDHVSKISDSNKMSHFDVDITEVSGEKDEEEEEAREEVSRGSTTPPKNALLLTRCRSAPFRSSSLAVQFWGKNGIGDQVNEASCYGLDQQLMSTEFRHDKEEESEEISENGKQQVERKLRNKKHASSSNTYKV